MVGNNDRYVELFGQFHEFAQKFAEVLLTLAQLSTAREVNSIERHDRIDDKERVVVLHHHRSGRNQQSGLMFSGVGSRIRNVGQHCVFVETIPLRNRSDSLGSAAITINLQTVLRVDVHDLSFTSAHLSWQLSSDGQRMADLSLSCSVLAIDLSDGLAFHSPL